MFGIENHPWNTTEYCSFREENANEMFLLNRLYGKIVGNCYAQATFNEAVFRLWGLDPDKIFITVIGLGSGGHAVNLINFNDKWFIFDSVNYSHPVHKSHFYYDCKCFREFSNESIYTVFEDFNSLYTSKSNINMRDIKTLFLDLNHCLKVILNLGVKRTLKIPWKHLHLLQNLVM